MDQRRNESSCRAHHPTTIQNCDSRQRLDGEAKDPVVARKVQKADREKLRRDRLNEQFNELGNAVDPDRPKNDKATILTDTIQLLKDLNDEVTRLKTEYDALTEESRELTQEKNELREEKSSLKSDIDNLNAQYQQRIRAMYPWGAMDPSVVMAPSPYSFPLPVGVPSAPIPMHPSLQPYPYYGTQNPGTIAANHRSPFVPYPAPANPLPEQQPPQPQPQPQQSYASTSQPSVKQDTKSKSSSRNVEGTDESNDVVTELELKTPGSSVQQESSSVCKKGKQPIQRKEISATDGGSSSRLSSSQGPKESSSNSVGHV